jgi:hypothetical protein
MTDALKPSDLLEMLERWGQVRAERADYDLADFLLDVCELEHADDDATPHRDEEAA